MLRIITLWCWKWFVLKIVVILKENFEEVAICTLSKTSVMPDCFCKPVPKQIIASVSSELTTCFRCTSERLLAHLVWGQLICSNPYVVIEPTFILVCLVWLYFIFIFIFFAKRDVGVELVHRPKSCCVSSIMQVSPLAHRFWKPSFQKSWQSGLSEALERFQYLFIWNKDIKAAGNKI